MKFEKEKIAKTGGVRMKCKKILFAVVVSAFLVGCGDNTQQVIFNGKEGKSSVSEAESSLVKEATKIQTVAPKVEEVPSTVPPTEPPTDPPTEPPTEPTTEPKPVSVYINDLQYMSCKHEVLTQNKLEDNIGNTYHTGIYIAGGVQYKASGGSADYYIQGKYTDFSGIIAVPKGYESIDYYSSCFQIYGDGNLLYSSPVMTNTSFPESFSVDITDVQMLTISYPDSINGCGDMATIYDGLLS